MVDVKERGVWDKIAGKWNEFRVRISPTAEKFIRGHKGKILDLGCGSGRNFLKVDGLKWYAVDFSGKMIEFAEKKGKEIGIDLDARVADCGEIPFADDYFDAVICYAVLHCVDSTEARRKTIEEIYRVLKSGGEALISVWGKSGRLKNKGKECYVPWSLGEDKELRYTYVYDLDELVELCREVGFEIVSAWEERNVNVIVRK